MDIKKFFIDMMKKVSGSDMVFEILQKMAKIFSGHFMSRVDELGQLAKELKDIMMDGQMEQSQKSSKMMEKMKKMMKEAIKKIIKAIIKTIVKFIKWIVQLFIQLVSTPWGWCALIVLILIIILIWLGSLTEALGGFRGTVIVDIDKMKEMNVDSSDYTDLLNTDALMDSFYQEVSNKSFYQMFNVRDMDEDNLDGLTKLMIEIGARTSWWGPEGGSYKDRKNKMIANAFANEKQVNGVDVYNTDFITGFSGILNFPSFDPRYIYTDANKNPLKYLKRAELVGTNENSSKLTAYFRDYYQRESTFMLSEELLYELNRYMYSDKTGATHIVYPEAFTQPLHFVNDYMRIIDDTSNKKYGEDYVYVTKRVHLDDIRDTTSQFYNKYALEGIIYSTPSKYVYDYAIFDSNVHTIRPPDHDSTSGRQINIGNVSDYVTYSYKIQYDEDNDEDTDVVEETVRLYWKIKEDKMDEHMGIMIGENNVCEYFEGPYLEFDPENTSNPFKKSLNVCKSGSTTVSGDGELKIGVVTIDTDANTVTYSTKAYNKDFKTVKESDDKIKYIDPKMNLFPRKHVQVAPIEDEEGNVIATSRNLFNKTYIQVKTIKEPYRSSDEYWSRFYDFVQEDITRSADRTPCTGDNFVEDHKLDWSSRQCSLIRYYMTSSITDWTEAKIRELWAVMTTGDVKNATMEITEKAMYGILLDYEDYLMSVGSYNVEWEYKYFSQTEDDKLRSAAEHSPNILKKFQNGAADMLLKLFAPESDTSFSDVAIYKNTFDSVVNDNKKRSVASEYVPVAIITGNEVVDDAGTKTYASKNDWGWGYKYIGEQFDSNGNYKVKAVYGEASMQFPKYYTFSETDDGLIKQKAWSFVSKYANTVLSSNDIRVKIINKAADFFMNTSYGEVTYGMPNFKSFWQKDDHGNLHLSEMAWYGSDGSETSAAWLNYKTVKDENGNYIDFRNDDYVWNPYVDVWRPSAYSKNAKEATLIKCQNLQCGRVTESSSPDDYLPMEVKGVRDYGLGSILSYIESRKVVFNTGVSMGERYNKKGVEDFVNELASRLGSKGKDVLSGTDGVKGYIPKEILDLALEGYSYEVNGETIDNADFMSIYRLMPTSIENLEMIAAAFTAVQYENSEADKADKKYGVSIDGCNYYLEDKNASQYVIKGTGDNCLEDLYAFVPHIYDKAWLEDVWSWLVGGETNYDQNQYWDPMYYYLSWFDFFEEEINKDANLWQKILAFVEDDKFHSRLDTEVAIRLRNIKNNKVEGENYDLGDLLFVSKWMTDVFFDEWTVLTEADMDDLYERHSSQLKGMDLIDRIQSQRVYLIEEAATFIGEFMYTYKDKMETIGNLTHEDAIISDVAFIDRYYYLSNYIFALPSIDHKIHTSQLFYDDPDSCTKNCKSAKQKCKKWLEDLEKSTTTIVWWKPWTWFQKADRVYDFNILGTGTNCLKGTTGGDDPETVYRAVVKYKDIKGGQAVIMDTADETIDLIEQLKENGKKSTAEKVMINLKVYANVEGWAGLIKDNESDIHDGINYKDDTLPTASTDYKKTPGVSDLNNFTTYKKTFENISFRKGLLVNYGDKTDTTKMLQTDNLNFDDEKYEIGFKDGISEDLVGDIATDNSLDENDLKNIQKAIMDIHGLKNTFKTDTTTTVSVGESEVKPFAFGYKSGREWGDSDEMLVSVLYADRASSGYALPLFMHVAGDTKQIMPEQIEMFFDGEVLETWKKRVKLTDEDSMYRDEYIRNYHKGKETYVYDYLENFEAYVPLDVKSDEDMQLRGKDAFLSIGSSKTTPVEKVAASSSTIMMTLETPEWQKIIGKYHIKKESLGQLLSGLMEYSLDSAPDRMIMEYNTVRGNNGLTLIKDNYGNREKIQKAIDATMYIEMNGGVNVNNIRKVELELNDGTTEKFLLPYIGVGGIKNCKFNGNGGKGSVNGNLETVNDPDSNDYIKLTINDTGTGTDDRLSEQKSIEYVSIKFRKLFSKYNTVTGAIMAYFYGEEYWDSLRKVAAEDGLSTGPEWYVAEDSMIEKAVCLVLEPDGGGSCSEDINPDLYSSEAVDEVLSYVNSIDDRVKMIRLQGTSTLDTEIPEGSNRDIVFAYFIKILQMDEQHALSLMGVMNGESGGWEPHRLEGGCYGTFWDYEEGGFPGSDKGWCDFTEKYIAEVDKYTTEGDMSKMDYFLECSPEYWHSGCMTGSYKNHRGFGIVQWTSAGRKRLMLEKAKEAGASIGDLLFQLDYLKYELENGYKKIYDKFLQTDDPYEQVSIMVREFERPANQDLAVTTRMGYRTELETQVQEMRDAAGTFDDGSLTGGGSTISGGNSYQNTSGYNAYARDELSLQNSGIELWIPPTTFKRNDIDLVMLSQASRDGEIIDELNSYDLLSLFTSRQYAVGSEGAIGGAWETVGAIEKVGSGTPRDHVKNAFSNMPPLFRPNRPYAEGVPMRVNSPFGYRTVGGKPGHHSGIDLDDNGPTDIFAIAPGEVITSVTNYGPKGYGNYVEIEHYLSCISDAYKKGDDYIVTSGGKSYKIIGIRSLYAHMLNTPEVKKGDIITTESIKKRLGVVGSTGHSTGPHLHFEIKVRGQEISETGVLGARTEYLIVDPQIWLTTDWKSDSGGDGEEGSGGGTLKGYELIRNY